MIELGGVERLQLLDRLVDVLRLYDLENQHEASVVHQLLHARPPLLFADQEPENDQCEPIALVVLEVVFGVVLSDDSPRRDVGIVGKRSMCQADGDEGFMRFTVVAGIVVGRIVEASTVVRRSPWG